MTSYAVMTENADLMEFFEKKMTTDVCKYMCDNFLDKNFIELGLYKLSYNKNTYTLNNKNSYIHKINVIKKTKKFISYKIIPTKCIMKKTWNNYSCDDPNIDFECYGCQLKREDKTFRKKIFTDDNGIEYCNIDIGDHRGKNYYKIYSNDK